jgi:CheY-like chemotaxis protein
MVHGLAAQLGGAFALSSSLGKGTRADLYLPFAVDVKSASAPQSERRPLRTGRQLRILLVDDEELVRVGTSEMLRDLGHEVIEASDGGTALACLRDDERIDAVVSDFKMPRMDGAELAAKIRAVHPEMPILLITGYTGSTDEAANLPRLAKPYSQADLAHSLAEVTGLDKNIVQFPVRGRDR